MAVGEGVVVEKDVPKDSSAFGAGEDVPTETVAVFDDGQALEDLRWYVVEVQMPADPYGAAHRG